MKRDRKEQLIKKKFDDILYEDFLTGKRKREERRRLKKYMSKVSRQKSKNVLKDEI